jgi:hypothetical protein
MSHTTTVKSVPIKDIRALRAAINELKAKGVNIELEQNAVPRMYYANQLQKHMGRQSEVCDYVVRVKDAYYDIGLIKEADGSFTPVFDDYNYSSSSVPATKEGSGPIRDSLGAKFEGKVDHWSGARQDTEQTLHSIGKLLQGYTKHATIFAATQAGYQVQRAWTDSEGNVQLELNV